jgi:hypothetical protein
MTIPKDQMSALNEYAFPALEYTSGGIQPIVPMIVLAAAAFSITLALSKSDSVRCDTLPAMSLFRKRFCDLTWREREDMSQKRGKTRFGLTSR